MEIHKKVFKSNTAMILIPGLFFGTALILRNREELSVLIWILLGIGAVLTLALVLSFTTVIISANEIGIKNLKKSQVINKKDIIKQSRKTSFARGIETIRWKLHLQSGEIVTISSELFRDANGLIESLDSFLSNIPKK